MYKFGIMFLILTVTGCAAMLVPATSDRHKKLAYAETLVRQNRPLPAERLIMEAREIYQNGNDDLGLAESYRQYAFFLRFSDCRKLEHVLSRKRLFGQNSFIYTNRYQKAIEYFQQAKEIYTKHSEYDALTNINLVMGHAYTLLIKDHEKACKAYDESLASYAKYKEQKNHATDIGLPKRFKSYEDYMKAVKKEAQCP